MSFMPSSFYLQNLEPEEFTAHTPHSPRLILASRHLFTRSRAGHEESSSPAIGHSKPTCQPSLQADFVKITKALASSGDYIDVPFADHRTRTGKLILPHAYWVLIALVRSTRYGEAVHLKLHHCH